MVTVEAGDLTPAETASRTHVQLGTQVARRHAQATSHTLPFGAPPAQVQALLARTAGATRVVVGTINASDDDGQVSFVRELARRDSFKGDGAAA